MIWQLMERLTPACRWFVDNIHNEGCWRYRIGFFIFARAWWHSDDKIGWRYFPHFMAADRRVKRGQSIIWPGWNYLNRDEDIPF